jgi:hypothetical protein
MPFTRVQSNNFQTGSGSSLTVAVTLGSVVTSGSTLIVEVGWASIAGDTIKVETQLMGFRIRQPICQMLQTDLELLQLRLALAGLLLQLQFKKNQERPLPLLMDMLLIPNMVQAQVLMPLHPEILPRQPMVI